MSRDDIVAAIRRKYERVSAVLDERGRRKWALAEAEALGYGRQSLVAKATGLSRMTLYAEKAIHVEKSGTGATDQIRKRGGGRKKLTERDPALLAALEGLVEPTTRGDPDNPLRWT